MTTEEMIAQRQKGWKAFTTATTIVAVGVALVLVGMAVFLL